VESQWRAPLGLSKWRGRLRLSPLVMHMLLSLEAKGCANCMGGGGGAWSESCVGKNVNPHATAIKEPSALMLLLLRLRYLCSTTSTPTGPLFGNSSGYRVMHLTLDCISASLHLCAPGVIHGCQRFLLLFQQRFHANAHADHSLRRSHALAAEIDSQSPSQNKTRSILSHAFLHFSE
jgi:hypothetical protein